jgi:hypothetical protein
MSRDEYQPNERIIDRVVYLWIRALRMPVYDNGDHSAAGVFSQILAGSLPNNSTDETLTAFGRELKSRLMVQRTEKPYREGADPYTHWVTSLEVDYDPDAVLYESAQAVGLKTKFPWKTRMHFYDDYVQFSEGYAAESFYHYPVPGGRWLVTTIRGGKQDIDYLLRFAQSEGELPLYPFYALETEAAIA